MCYMLYTHTVLALCLRLQLCPSHPKPPWILIGFRSSRSLTTKIWQRFQLMGCHSESMAAALHSRAHLPLVHFSTVTSLDLLTGLQLA